MKLNPVIKCLFIISFLFFFKISYCKVIINDDVLIDIPEHWIDVNSKDFSNSLKNAQNQGIKVEKPKNSLGIWTFKKTNDWTHESNILISRFSNNAETKYRNYLIEEYKKISEDMMIGFIKGYKSNNFSITNKKFYFNRDKDLLTIDFVTSGNGISFYQSNAFIFTESHIYLIQATINYDSLYKQNKSEFDDFIFSIDISQNEKIKDVKDNFLERIGTGFKEIFDFARTEDGKNTFMFLFFIFIAFIFFELKKDKKPNNMLYRFIARILKMIFSMSLRIILQQPHSNHSHNQTNDTSTTHQNDLQNDNIDHHSHATDIDDALSSNVLDNHLSDNLIVDDNLSENLKLDDNLSDKK